MQATLNIKNLWMDLTMNTRAYKQQLLTELYHNFPHCNSFPVPSQGATQVVYGQGNPDAALMIIGEAPGKQEDEQGKPFVGRSGQLLTHLLHKAGLERADVFITNVVKCRPPNNRTPTPQEVAVFKKLVLVPEIHIIRPQVILTVGAIALEAILEQPAKITKMRGTTHTCYQAITIPTFHPAYILRNPQALPDFYRDIQLAVSLIEKNKKTT